MNRYKRLLSNTFLFGISTFSSKILVFLLMPLYTRVLPAGEMGIATLIIQTVNLLIPVVSLGIMNAVVRFGLDKGYSKQGVFTTGFVTILGGFLAFVLLMPLAKFVPFLDGYIWLLYLYVLCACMRSLFSQFVRAKMYTRLYAFDGLFSTILTIGFTLLYLLKFEMGVTGYLLAIVSADIGSAIFLFFTADLYRYLKKSALSKPLFQTMLKYALPMVPSTMFWWVTNVSDQYMVAAMLGTAATGLYSVAYKIPTIVTLFSTIFTEAWQLSAVEAQGSKNRNWFFSNVFTSLQGIVFLLGSALILFSKLIMRVWVDASYFEAWRFIPILILATVYSCFSSFLSSVYMVEKKSNLSLITTFIGAVINVVLNLFLIPKVGVNGAAIATFASYFTVFIIRMVNTRQFIKINIHPAKMMLNTGLLLGQTVLVLSETRNWVIGCSGLFICALLLNGGTIINGIQKILKKDL